MFAYLYHDHLHGVLQATDPTGLDLGVRTYSAFGAVRRRQGDLLTDRHFTGQVEDATGLYYYHARYYDPQLGQFISPDTIAPDPKLLVCILNDHPEQF